MIPRTSPIRRFFRSDAFLILLFLGLAFSVGLAFLLVLPPGRPTWVHEILPYAILGGGLALAAWAARRAHHRASQNPEAGIYCSHCGYNLKATPDRCPECGCMGTAKTVTPPTRREAMMQAVTSFAWMTFIALLAAGVIMLHLQLHAMPMTGGH
jgi:hypothetical protein